MVPALGTPQTPLTGPLQTAEAVAHLFPRPRITFFLRRLLVAVLAQTVEQTTACHST